MLSISVFAVDVFFTLFLLIGHFIFAIGCSQKKLIVMIIGIIYAFKFLSNLGRLIYGFGSDVLGDVGFKFIYRRICQS